MTTGKKILVTGGAGFLGSHLCERLLHEGNDVICLDNLLTGNRQRIAHLIANPAFFFVEHDVVAPIDLQVDEIYHLASPASPKHYASDAIRTILINVQGAANMLELARKNSAKILQASTSEIYGDPEVHPQPEHYWGNVNPIGTRACYKEAKRCAETLFFEYRRQHNLSIKIARIFNCYGPGMHPEDGRVVSNFISRALRHEPLLIHGNGTQTRSFCYVDDMIDGLIKLMRTHDDVTGPVNLGNPNEHSILELAELTRVLTSSKSDIAFKPAANDDPQRRNPDIRLAMEQLEWQPEISLPEGLRRTIDDFKNKMA